jgi:hypothetical protein
MIRPTTLQLVLLGATAWGGSPDPDIGGWESPQPTTADLPEVQLDGVDLGSYLLQPDHSYDFRCVAIRSSSGNALFAPSCA